MRLIVVLLAFAPSAVEAHDCHAYLDTTPALTSINAALGRFAGVTPKGEFETTEQYEGRIKAMTESSEPIIIPRPVNQEHLTYDADKQAFEIGPYFFDNESMPVQKLWEFGGPFFDVSKLRSRFDNIDVVINEQYVDRGSFKARNAFGVSLNIQRLDRVYWGVFERTIEEVGPNSYLASHLIETNGYSDALGWLNVPSSSAREFKKTVKAAIVVTPKEPWILSYRDKFSSKATISNPVEITDVMNILFADIQCALIIDKSNKVVKVFETR